MNILVLTPYLPYPPSFGGSVRIYNLMRQLHPWHTLFLVSYRAENQGPVPIELRDMCRAIETVPWPRIRKRVRQLASLLSPHSFQWHIHRTPAMQLAIDQTLEKQAIDLILVEFSQMASFAFPLDVPLVIDQHNVEYDLIRRMTGRAPCSARKLHNLLEAAKYKREELRALRKARLVLATSARDADLMRRNLPGLKTAVVANGVDCAYFANPGVKPKPNTIVFVGATHYYPNEDGIHFYMREIAPLVRREVPDVKTFFVGGRPPSSIEQYSSNTVVVTGFVDDVRPYIHHASAFIVPLRMGGGTRFKVVEAMAAGTPVISTRLGSEGIPLTSGKQALLADAPAEFAAAVVRVLRDKQTAVNLRTAGLDFVRRHFDWAVIGASLNENIERCRRRDHIQ